MVEIPWEGSHVLKVMIEVYIGLMYGILYLHIPKTSTIHVRKYTIVLWIPHIREIFQFSNPN